jgi:hypothetical protein
MSGAARVGYSNTRRAQRPVGGRKRKPGGDGIEHSCCHRCVTVAAFQPSDIAKSHRAAATAYERLARKLDDVEALELGDCKEQIPVEKIDAVRTEIAKLEEELDSIELSHPPVSSFKQHKELNSTELSHSPASNFTTIPAPVALDCVGI